MVIYNAGKNFAFIEFKQLVNLIIIKIKEVLIKAYNNIGLVKRYYIPLQYVYEIIQDELKDKYINKEIILQMAIKAVNDLAGPNRIVQPVLGTVR